MELKVGLIPPDGRSKSAASNRHKVVTIDGGSESVRTVLHDRSIGKNVQVGNWMIVVSLVEPNTGELLSSAYQLFTIEE